MTRRDCPSGALRRYRARGSAAVGVALLMAAVGCGGGDDRDRSDLSAAPTGVRWQAYQGVSLPHADQGPKQTVDGAATGFERSPVGAALAAIIHQVRLSVAVDGQWGKVAAQEVVPDRAKDEWAVSRLQLSITGPVAPEYAPRLLGYKITAYTDDRSAVDVYTEYSDKSRAVNHTTVEWFGKDWRLRLPDPESTARHVEAIDVLPTDIVTLEAPK
ncbi:hypothetical protein [Nocardia sp. NPDC052566]|uniref:hypothetical protein n=1 Tax=Nocardia sp. NPDC052566 TaxID=3364330 RepID=UPI0037CA88E8